MPTSSLSRRLLAGGLLAAILGSGFAPTAATAAPPPAAIDYAELVNTFVSTEDDFGQDLPGAEAPSSIVKINPMTTPGRSHSGYDYAEDQIAGFTHTNLNGVGGSGGGGDLLVVPTYTSYSSVPTTSSYAKDYSHDAEDAEPGYYGVELETARGPILAEATTDVRTGQDRFTFPEAGTASLVVDLRNNFTRRNAASIDVTTLADGRVALAGEIGGHFNGYDYEMYYYVETTTAPSNTRTWGASGALGTESHQDGTNLGAILDFDVAAGEQLGLEVAISPISAAQAKIDLAAEMGDRGFDDVRADTKADWNEILGRLAVTASETSDPDGELQKLFYTHLYRLFGQPVNATSTSGTYRGLDGEISEADGYTHYDGWGTWDDFRKFEVLAIGYPEVFRDMAQSLVDLYGSFTTSGASSLSGVVHSVPTVRFERAAVVIADAVAKGADLSGLEEAWPALVSQSQGGYGNPDNVKRGYIANEVDDTLGTAYDDTALATIADALGKTEEAQGFRLRAANWTNLFKDDAVTVADGDTVGLVFPKDGNGAWVNANPEQFEAGNVYQGTLWQYNWTVASDMGGMIDLMGGQDETLAALSFMFGEQAPDDGSRMLFSSANETDLQVPYLFNYVGEPSKTQEWVRNLYTKETWNRYIATGSTGEYPTSGGEFRPPIKTKVYQNSPQGFLPTQDNDTGAMSATFVAAALGLYPVQAGSDEYQIGTPFFENVQINYESGRTFDISADGVSPDDYFIQSAALNGQDFERTWITYDQLTAGGELAFQMGDEASDWAEDGVASSSLSDVLPSSTYDRTSAVSVSSREFTEAEAGDGSVGNEISLTLANGAFAGKNGDDLTGDGAISAENLPEGLSLVATRTGDRSVTLSLAGQAAEHGTLDSIDDLELSVGDSTFRTKPSAGAREFSFKVTFDGATLTAERTTLTAAADGTVDTSVALSLSGATFAGANGRDLVADGALTVPGLPSGVTASAVKRDDTTIDLRLTGSLGASQRAAFALAFTDAALSGVLATELRGDGVSGLGTLTLAVDQEWRAKLAALVEEAELVVEGAYTETSFAAFSAARESAKAVLDDAAATDEQLKGAFTTLTKAAAALAIADTSEDLVLGDTLYGEVLFDDDFSTDRSSEYTVFGDSSEPSADISVDTASGTLTATADGRRFSHIALPVSGGEDFALVVEPESFAGTKAAEDSLFVGLTDGPTNRAHSWFNNTRAETGMDFWVGGEGKDSGAGSLTGVQWNPGDRFATVVADGVITSWMEEDGSWRKLRSGVLTSAVTPEQLLSWDPTLSLRLDTGAISIDRVTLLGATEAAPIDPVRIQAEGFTDSSGGTLVAEGASPSGNVGGTYDGGRLTYADVDFGAGELSTLTVRTSTRDERVGANPRLEFYLDEVTPANMVGAVALPKTGGWGNYVTTTVDLDAPVTGEHTLVVVMHSDPVAGQSYQYVSNLDWFEFAPAEGETTPVDFTELRAAIADAKTIVEQEERYIAIDFAAFRRALAAAQSVVERAESTQYEADAALRILTAAADQLEWKVVRQLPLLIAEAEAVDSSLYTPESVAVLESALATARAVAEDASYETYVGAFDGLTDALAGLVEPTDPTDPPVDPTDPPVDPTDPPVDPTDPPVDPTDPPVDPTDPPTDPTDPTDPTTPGAPSFAPSAPAETGDDLPEALRDRITVSVSGRIATLGGLDPSSWHYVYVYSEPTALGWVEADADGSATVTLPASVTAGEHRIAVLDDAGELMGWAEFTLAAGEDDGGLAVTGGAVGWAAGVLAILLMALGATLVIARRRGLGTR
ncbi:glycoside hydrolase domain-containing protein [Labedella endophytica]|uniref:Carbohydrate-binding protein n=1 Tax=Labedella endophytica TaxID=1523160 RepID=A0A3S0VH26_9MICO|nr:glycoside hydrolase domain-containing protein [Labedella endophytica]RUR01736.1 carbohydrate-binding protein [Labedella endophytica]